MAEITPRPAAGLFSSLSEEAEAALQQKGRTDSLLRFFDSQFFDEWIAVSYLWRTRAEARQLRGLPELPALPARPGCCDARRRGAHGAVAAATQGVRDYLCNRMYSLNLTAVERYLAQVVIMAVSRPSAALDRLVLDFCARSLRLSCKARPPGRPGRRRRPRRSRAGARPLSGCCCLPQISWWLDAYQIDGRTTPEVVRALRKKCDEAALNGTRPARRPRPPPAAKPADAAAARSWQGSGPSRFGRGGQPAGRQTMRGSERREPITQPPARSGSRPPARAAAVTDQPAVGAQSTQQASMELVNALCQASASLVKVLPAEDRPVSCPPLPGAPPCSCLATRSMCQAGRLTRDPPRVAPRLLVHRPRCGGSWPKLARRRGLRTRPRCRARAHARARRRLTRRPRRRCRRLRAGLRMRGCGSQWARTHHAL